jgi:type I restriction enzyme S subunit
MVFKSLFEVADVIDPHPSHRAPPIEKNGIPFVGIGDVDEYGKIDIDKSRKVSETVLLEHKNRYVIDDNSIGYGRVATVGKVIRLKKHQDLEYVLSPTLALINPRKDLIDPDYLYYQLLDEFFSNQVKMNLTGSTRDSLGIKILRKISISYPPISVQKKIGNTLSSIDEKIELNIKINKNLEELVQTLYKRWFVDFEFPNEEGKPYKSSGGEMIDSELGLIPKGWKVIKIDEILIFERGIEPGSKYYSSVFKENLIPFYRVGDLETRNNVYIDKLLTKDKFVDERDVLVSFDGAIGRTGIGFVGSYSTGLRKVYDKSKKFKNSLIYFIMKSDSIQNTMKEHANGTTILHASTSIPYLKIAYKYEVLKEFELKIDPIFHELIILKKQNKYLENLRDLLLPKLMSGEIEAPDME